LKFDLHSLRDCYGFASDVLGKAYTNNPLMNALGDVELDVNLAETMGPRRARERIKTVLKKMKKDNPNSALSKQLEIIAEKSYDNEIEMKDIYDAAKELDKQINDPMFC
jgi:hypothetical protein